MNWKPIQELELKDKEVKNIQVWLKEPLLGRHCHTASWGKNIKLVSTMFHYDCPNVTHYMEIPKGPNGEIDAPKEKS